MCRLRLRNAPNLYMYVCCYFIFSYLSMSICTYISANVLIQNFEIFQFLLHFFVLANFENTHYIYLSIYAFIHLSIFEFIYISIYNFIYLSINEIIYLFTGNLSICLSIYEIIYLLPGNLSIYNSIRLSIYELIYLSIYEFIYLSMN